MTEMQQRQPQQMTFSQYVNSPTGKRLISNALKPSQQGAFTTAIISAVSANPELQQCTPPSIISAALQGVALGLAPSPQLGQFYMIPFKNKKEGTTTATFVLGYRGLIQLAIRSGLYVDIDARPVVEGEYRGRDKYTGRPVFEWIEDDTERESRPVVGYIAYYELTNGARKVIYWSKEKMLNHADRYSAAFSKEASEVGRGGRYHRVSFADYEAGNYPKGDEWLYSSLWYQDFDAMACKTMLRQLISKWGPVSIEMSTVLDSDETAELAGVDYTPPEIMLPPSANPADSMDGIGQGPEATAIAAEAGAQEFNLDDL